MIIFEAVGALLTTLDLDFLWCSAVRRLMPFLAAVAAIALEAVVLRESDGLLPLSHRGEQGGEVSDYLVDVDGLLVALFVASHPLVDHLCHFCLSCLGLALEASDECFHDDVLHTDIAVAQVRQEFEEGNGHVGWIPVIAEGEQVLHCYMLEARGVLGQLVIEYFDGLNIGTTIADPRRWAWKTVDGVSHGPDDDRKDGREKDLVQVLGLITQLTVLGDSQAFILRMR